MHLAGFEPATSILEADYESDAFDHLATDANGAGGIWTHVHLDFSVNSFSCLKTACLLWSKNFTWKCASLDYCKIITILRVRVIRKREAYAKASDCLAVIALVVKDKMLFALILKLGLKPVARKEKRLNVESITAPVCTRI